MKSVDSCIICGSKNLKFLNTKCSPFLAERIWGSEPFDVKLTHCNNCDFTFYNPRLDNEELARLYKNYRDPEYQKQREKYEKGYSIELNESIGNNIAEIEERKSNMSSIITGRFDIKKIRNVLDFGGDRGQFIMDEFDDTDRYVYDISGAPLLPEIKRIVDIAESDKKKFDFIMCCYVLEHVPDPNELIDRIMKFSHKETKFYIELPFQMSPVMTGVFFMLFNFISSHGRIFRFYAKKRGCPVEGAFFQMHEHINFFSIKSLKRLLESRHLKVEYITIRQVKLSVKNKLLCCYATIK